jgi:hypothetical protein
MQPTILVFDICIMRAVCVCVCLHYLQINTKKCRFIKSTLERHNRCGGLVKPVFIIQYVCTRQNSEEVIELDWFSLI